MLDSPSAQLLAALLLPVVPVAAFGTVEAKAARRAWAVRSTAGPVLCEVRSRHELLRRWRAWMLVLVSLLGAMIRAAGAFMLSERSAPFALFMGREQQAPSPEVLELMQAKIMPMIRSLSQQVAILRPDLDETEAKAVTVFLFGMAITLRHSRTSLSLLLGSDMFDAATRTMLLDQLESSARALLAGGEE